MCQGRRYGVPWRFWIQSRDRTNYIGHVAHSIVTQAISLRYERPSVAIAVSAPPISDMTRNSAPLPDFERPPVTEVALGVQFEPITGLISPMLGLYWGAVRDRFPRVEQQPPLPAVIERTGTRQITPITVPLQLMQSFPNPRLWLLDQNQKEMIQVQQDRFVRNWRKLSPEDNYPRYNDRLFPEFCKDLEHFKQFLMEQKLPVPHANQCEINYVNQIHSGEVWETHRDISQVFKLVGSEEIDTDMLSFEDGRLYFRYEMHHEEEFVGRLHIVVEPGFDSVGAKPVFMVNLTARGKPLSDDDQGVLNFLNLGHEVIVRTFTKITTTKMHKIWRRTDDNRKSGSIH